MKLRNFLLFFCSLFLLLVINYSNAQTPHRPRVGIVLSGGGAKGFAHIGVLKVLEEAGIPIDYIGGTSMGSIIGGLYAIGYRADTLRHIVNDIDWAEMLTDKVPRKYLTIDEKEYEGKYFFPYPISNGKFQMPSSMISGQNFETTLSRLLWNRMDSCDFSKLPIPFLCVATDIVNGHAEVFHNGYLTRSIRASMSIPTLFSPVYFNGNMYVDGGIYNNFPVKDVKEMGADIIIGVDVGFEPFPASELNTMLRIITQSVFTHTVESNNENRRMCKILIRPDLKHFTMMNFDKPDTLVQLGEISARTQFEGLKRLADSIRELGYVADNKISETRREYNISNIKVIGFKKIPRTYILSKFGIRAPSQIKCCEVEEGIKRVYGTLLFKSVSYRFDENDGTTELVLEVEEKAQSVFSLGINYNTDYKASLYFNSSFYNLIRNGSKLSVDALLGENPKINTTFFIFSGWNPKGLSPISGGWRFDFGLNVNTSHYKLFNYNDSRVVSKYGFTDISATLFTQTTFVNSYAWGLGVQNEFTSRKVDINPFNDPASSYKLFNLISYIKFDTYNRSNFPSKGVAMNIEGKYLTSMYRDGITPGFIINGQYGMALPLTKRLTINANVYAGCSIIDSLPETYMYRLGGMATYYVRNAFPFYGYRLHEIAGKNAAVARLGLQTEIFSKNFITLSCNAGRFDVDLKDVFLLNKNIYGYCISYGYNSIIGPIELSIMKSPKHRLLAYLNVGFWF
jgi:NTE family protein